MGSNTTSNYINNYIINNRANITLEAYTIENKVESNNTINIEDTILKFSLEIRVLFCPVCSINIVPNNYIKHLKKKHKTLYNRYKEDNIVKTLINKVNTLELNELDTLKTILTNNTYYFKEIPILFNNYKYLDYNFININRKEIRKYYNKVYKRGSNNNNEEVDYIIDNIPLQVLEGFKDNKKHYFISKLPIIDTNLDINTNTNLDSSSSNLSSTTNSNTSSSRESSLERVNNKNRNIDNNTKNKIIEKYKKEEENKQNSFNLINNLENNKKLLNSFTRKSNIIEFLENKNRNILTKIVYNIEDNTNINLEELIDFIKLEEIIIESLSNIDNKITNIPLLSRYIFNTETTNKTNFKDFIPLETNTRKGYFKYYSNLITFIIKVYYI